MTDMPPQEPSVKPDPGSEPARGFPLRMLRAVCWIWGAGSRKMKSLYLWVLHWAETPYGTPALFGLSFAEASFFPIPPDPLQIALSVSKPKRSFYYALVNGLGSVSGAALGWAIGYFLWESSGDLIIRCVPGLTQARYGIAADYFKDYGFLAILIAAFTPIPFKVFTITAGALHTSLWVLLIASVIGRFARFFAVGGCIYMFGPSIKDLLDKYFDLIAVAFCVLLVGGFVVIACFF